ncbi:hypothetical protein GCM10022381_10640 [Leifsonia kafniensis]|uniref:DUF1648 domain-containing protein n=1 Tax=Leifsonia kafniensis TaxID=475957 RepID=A0ABP7K8P6_9MICO
MIGAVLVWVPLTVVVTTFLAWRHKLPEDLPRQWGANGVASTMPTWLFLTVALMLTLCAAIGATLALPAGAAPNRPTIYLASGCVAAIVAGIWLATVGVTVAAGEHAVPEIGGWPLLAILGGVYGLIPFLLARSGTVRDETMA